MRIPALLVVLVAAGTAASACGDEAQPKRGSACPKLDADTPVTRCEKGVQFRNAGTDIVLAAATGSGSDKQSLAVLIPTPDGGLAHALSVGESSAVASAIKLPATPTGAAAAHDFDGDGAVDVVAYATSPGQESKLLSLRGQLEGSFEETPAVLNLPIKPAESGNVQLVLDAQDPAEAAVVVCCDRGVARAQRVSVDSDGVQLQLVGPPAAAPSGPVSLRDMNGDGVSDLVVLDSGALARGRPTVQLATDDGFERYEGRASAREATCAERSPTVPAIDVDEDGTTDLVACGAVWLSTKASTVQAVREGRNTFGLDRSRLALVGTPDAAALAFTTGLAADNPGEAQVLIRTASRGEGNFDPIPLGDPSGRFQLLDANGDGKLDVVTLTAGKGSTRLALWTTQDDQLHPAKL